VPWIAGTKVKVAEIVRDKIAYGWSPEEIHFQQPHLSLAQILAALTWYYENQSSIAASIKHQVEEADSFAIKASDPEFRRKLVDLKRSAACGQEDGTAVWDDGPLLGRATERDRVMVSQDVYPLREGTRLLKENRELAASFMPISLGSQSVS